MTTLYLVDASPYIFRAWFAIPPNVLTPDGAPIQAAYGFLNTLFTLLRRDDLTHVLVTFDGSLTTSFRNDFHPEYKSTRGLPPPELENQLEACRALTQAVGVRMVVSDRYEADDLIAAALARFEDQTDHTVIVTSDKDLAQLVGDQVRWFDLAKNRTLGAEEIEELYGVRPDQLGDYLALRGDPVDDIPGVPGIGAKSAAALLQHFGSLDSLYQRLDEVPDLSLRGAKSVARKLADGRDSAELSKRLVRLATEAPLEHDFDALRYVGARAAEVDRVFAKYGFEGIRDRVPRWIEEATS